MTQKVAKPAAVSLWGAACAIFVGGLWLDEPAARATGIFLVGTSILVMQVGKAGRLERAVTALREKV